MAAKAKKGSWKKALPTFKFTFKGVVEYKGEKQDVEFSVKAKTVQDARKAANKALWADWRTTLAGLNDAEMEAPEEALKLYNDAMAKRAERRAKFAAKAEAETEAAAS